MQTWKQIPQNIEAEGKVRFPVQGRLTVDGHVLAKVVEERVEDFAQHGSFIDDGGGVVDGFQ